MPTSKDDSDKKETRKPSKMGESADKKPAASERTTAAIEKPVGSIKQDQEPKKQSFTKGQSIFGYLATIALSVFVAVLITVLTIPLMLRINPVAFYKGDFLNNDSQTVIKTGKSKNTISAVATKVGPSVVTIKVFKNKGGNLLFPELNQEDSSQPDASGSGVIYKSNGYIITNNHVIEDASKVLITIGKQSDIPGKIIAGDSENDIAVIKVNKSGLRAAEIGSTKELDVGDLAVAIGSPFEFQQTVTSGIVSAKNRAFDITDYGSRSSKTLTDLVQTDAAINPGNSGGGLADAEGRLIGINTAIASTSGSSAGIGFAIPIERAIRIADELISKGKVSHPYIGVAIRTVNAAMANEQDLVEGVLVQKVIRNSPAQTGGRRRRHGVRVRWGRRPASGDSRARLPSLGAQT
ncbi:hypothetical protein LCGC14_1749660 [marine sediment metagenome]|uniref:PDZ domain-containing protein n=1 Tax=marine sediment metagenome TaxID=412755 RepID=A0A0F9H4C5_9ZZZZ